MDTQISFESRNSKSLRLFLSTKNDYSFDWNEKGNAIKFREGGETFYVTDAAKAEVTAGNVDSLSITEFKRSDSDVWVPTIHIEGFKKGAAGAFHL